MARLFFLLPLFFCFNGYAQSHLGKTKTELLELCRSDFPRAETIYVNEGDAAYIQVLHGYETLFYHLEDDVCVMFEVLKPYSCDCLETDIAAYKKNAIALGNLKWVSKDYKKIYQMTLQQEYYSLSIIPTPRANEQRKSPVQYSDRGAY